MNTEYWMKHIYIIRGRYVRCREVNKHRTEERRMMRAVQKSERAPHR